MTKPIEISEADYSLLVHLTPEGRRRIFWESFWKAFRHPVLIYGYGFAAGFVVKGLLA